MDDKFIEKIQTIGFWIGIGFLIILIILSIKTWL